LNPENQHLAEDTRSGLAGSNGGLNIGAGTDMAASSFFFGPIDDVRIGDRTVKP
jgi:hypothetical protein